MKKTFTLITLLTSGIASAATPVNGWYSSVFGGYSHIPGNMRIYRNNLLFNNPSFNSGYHAGGRIGFKSNPLRYEAELSYISAKAKHFAVNSINQSGIRGHSQATALMGNVYYDFPEIVPAIEPFLGVGLGYAWVDTSLQSNGPEAAIRFNNSSTVFAYQGTAGLTYNFAENYALNVAYRYLATDKVHHLDKIYQANLATFGVVYRFDGSNYQ